MTTESEPAGGPKVTTQVPEGRIVIVGVGNELRGDDGAGLAVVRRLRSCLPPGVETVETNGETGALLDAWEDAALAVVVDAVSPGLAPGTVAVTEADALLPGGPGAAGTHGLGVAVALALGRVLGCLPGRLVVVGIEGRVFGLGARMSEAVAAAVETAAAEVLALIRSPCTAQVEGEAAPAPLARVSPLSRGSLQRGW